MGNGKTAIKVNLGKYLQGASVSNLAYTANPASAWTVAAASSRRPRTARGRTPTSTTTRSAISSNSAAQNPPFLA